MKTVKCFTKETERLTDEKSQKDDVTVVQRWCRSGGDVQQLK